MCRPYWYYLLDGIRESEVETDVQTVHYCKCSWLIAPTGSWVVLTGLCLSIILHYLQLSAPPSFLPSHSLDPSFPKLPLWSTYALVLGSVRYEQLSIYVGTAPVMNAHDRGCEEYKAQFFFISLLLTRYITALQQKRRSGMVSTVACHSIHFLFVSPTFFVIWCFFIFWGVCFFLIQYCTSKK